MTTSLNIWGQLREVALPLLLFWVAQLFGYACFGAAVIWSEGMDMKGLLILGFLAVVVFGTCLAGQVAALLQIRTWTALFLCSFFWGIGFALDIGLVSAGLGEVGIFLMLALMLGPPAAWAGMWSVETNRALWATWLPLIWTTGAVLIWSDKMDRDDAWFAGDKYAIWDWVSLPVFGGMVLLLLLYLVSRETHRLALWKRGRDAPLPAAIPERGYSRPRLTPLALLLLIGGGLMLTAGTALIAPYFWRTGPGDQPDDDGGQDPQEAPSMEEPQFPSNPEWGERLQQLLQQMQESAEQAAKAAFISFMVLILALLMFLVGYRPVKRLLLLRHLRDPLWRVSPTTRIEQGWRMVEVALGDAGVHPVPGEDASGLARRALPVLQRYSPVEVHGLSEAASAADRVRFGLGVTPADVDTMERFSAWALDTVWERLSEGQQLSAMYRGLG